MNAAPRWCSPCLFDEKQERALAECTTCEEYYCEKHLEQHARRKLTASHLVLQIKIASPIEHESSQDGVVNLSFSVCT